MRGCCPPATCKFYLFIFQSTFPVCLLPANSRSSPLLLPPLNVSSELPPSEFEAGLEPCPNRSDGVALLGNWNGMYQSFIPIPLQSSCIPHPFAERKTACLVSCYPRSFSTSFQHPFIPNFSHPLFRVDRRFSRSHFLPRQHVMFVVHPSCSSTPSILHLVKGRKRNEL